MHQNWISPTKFEFKYSMQIYKKFTKFDYEHLAQIHNNDSLWGQLAGKAIFFQDNWLNHSVAKYHW